MKYTGEHIYRLLLDLVAVPSVSPSQEEARLARLMLDKLSTIPYFAQGKGDLRLLPVQNDPYGRSLVFAMVKAEPPTKRTIILTGHMDVVEAQDLGLACDPFAPEQHTKQLLAKGLSYLPDEAARDLQSGDYLFGRGTMDMKAGLAMQMALLAELSETPGNLLANYIFLAVPDEENTSAGMRQAISELARLQKEGLQFLACVNSEGTGPKFDGDTNRYVDVGTIGKIMPFFYCVGRESHVGQYYTGLNANLLASSVNMLMEANPDMIDVFGEEAYPPPANLKHKDLRELYSVTLPSEAITYYNHLTVTQTPMTVLNHIKTLGQQAFENALAHLKSSTEKYEQKSGQAVDLPWRPRVMTYEQLLDHVGKEYDGDLKAHLLSFASSLPDSMDQRDRSIAVVTEALSLSQDKDPVIVVGFLPPFYPHRSNLRESPGERAVLSAVGELQEEARELGETLKLSEHFAAISDLSYLGFQGSGDDLKQLVANTPGWGPVYDLPTDQLLSLDVPVVNFGPHGKDAHKSTERLELHYSLHVAPILFKSLVMKLSAIHQE